MAFGQFELWSPYETLQTLGLADRFLQVRHSFSTGIGPNLLGGFRERSYHSGQLRDPPKLGIRLSCGLLPWWAVLGWPQQ